MSKTDKYAPDPLRALEAILARVRGEWDHPALVEFGPLRHSEGDIIEIAVAAIQRHESETLTVSPGPHCPHCGNADLEQILQLNDTTVWRSLDEYDAEAQMLTINGFYTSTDSEWNERYECQKCHEQFLLTDDIELDYV